jgi:transcriptional antiterminator
MPNQKITESKIKQMYMQYEMGVSVRKISKRSGVSYLTAYKHTKLKDRGYNTFLEYIKNQIAKKGFASYNTYVNYLQKERQSRPENFRLGRTIDERLIELNKTQNWLAEQMGVTKQSVSLYVQGKTLPAEEKLVSLFSALQLPYKTIDDLIKNYKKN